jgi:hypothetical protein
MVLPRALREELVRAPGEVLVRRTAEGVLLTPVPAAGTLEEADDGMPVLRVGRRVGNDEVLAAIDAERGTR